MPRGLSESGELRPSTAKEPREGGTGTSSSGREGGRERRRGGRLPPPGAPHNQ